MIPFVAEYQGCLGCVCESALAGYRNKHKTGAEMQRVNLFSLPCWPGDPQSSTLSEGHTVDLSPCQRIAEPAFLQGFTQA